MTLTTRQQLVLDTIHRLTLVNRQPPTTREIGKAMGIKSPNGVFVHLKALQRKGYIEKPTAQRARGIRIVNQEFCPCCGQRTTED